MPTDERIERLARMAGALAGLTVRVCPPGTMVMRLDGAMKAVPSALLPGWLVARYPQCIVHDNQAVRFEDTVWITQSNADELIAYAEGGPSHDA